MGTQYEIMHLHAFKSDIYSMELIMHNVYAFHISNLSLISILLEQNSYFTRLHRAIPFEKLILIEIAIESIQHSRIENLHSNIFVVYRYYGYAPVKQNAFLPQILRNNGFSFFSFVWPRRSSSLCTDIFSSY